LDAKTELHKIARKIDKVILDELQKEMDRSKSISPHIKFLLDNITCIASSGKRLRGAFLYYSYLMHGGKDLDEALRMTAFIELIHSYLLVHDDIMDNADLRRGSFTIHKLYADKYKNADKVDPRHFGEGVALCAGDILCHVGLQILTQSKFPAEYKLKAFELLHYKLTEVGYGQTLDTLGQVIEGVDEDYVLKVHYYKTGTYTYENPIHIGATLARGNDVDYKALSEYAIPAGIAFQLQDDILGMYGDEERLGKPADSDLKEGKTTLLIVYALDHATKDQRKILDRTLGNPNVTAKDLALVRNVIIDTGSLDYSKKVALKLVTKAKTALKERAHPSWKPEGVAFLEGIADYMINRKF